MNVEVFEYSVLASILGIIIVFLSLCGLSLLMVLIKVVFKERSVKQPAPTATGSAVALSSGPMVSAVPRQDNNWIMAAVAAFLTTEDEDSPKASGWTSGSSEKSDPWMNRATFDKKLG